MPVPLEPAVVAITGASSGIQPPGPAVVDFALRVLGAGFE